MDHGEWLGYTVTAGLGVLLKSVADMFKTHTSASQVLRDDMMKLIGKLEARDDDQEKQIQELDQSKEAQRLLKHAALNDLNAAKLELHLKDRELAEAHRKISELSATIAGMSAVSKTNEAHSITVSEAAHTAAHVVIDTAKEVAHQLMDKAATEKAEKPPHA